MIRGETPEPESIEAPGGGRLTGAEALDFTRQVAGLARAGLPLPSGLRALAEELGPGRLRRMLRDVAARLERGTSLEEAIEAQGDRFPTHLSGLIVAGARSGRLADVLGGFVGYYDVGDEIRRKLVLGLIYPALLLMTAATVFGVIALFITSQFDNIFKDFGVPIPVITQQLVQVARTVARTGWWLLTGPLTALVVCWVMGRLLFGAAERRRLLNSVPLVGPIWRWSSLAEFCNILALLLDAELPMAEALRLAGGGVRDADLAATAERMAGAVAGGSSLGAAAEGQRTLPDGFARFLSWTEVQPSPAGALRLAAGIFEARARAQAQFAGTFVGSLSVIAAIWGVAIVVFALFWPLLSLLNALAGPTPTPSPPIGWAETFEFLGNFQAWTVITWSSLIALVLALSAGLGLLALKLLPPLRRLRGRVGLRHLMFAIVIFALGFAAVRAFGVSIIILVGIMLPPLIGVGIYLTWMDRRPAQRDALLWALATAARDGLPLGPTTEAFAGLCNGSYRDDVTRLARRLEAGATLPEALDRVPRAFPRDAATVARVGWDCGTLSTALRAAAEAQDARRQTTPSLIMVVGYPVGLLGIIAIFAIFLMTWVAPHFESIYSDSGFELPWPTLVLSRLGRSLRVSEGLMPMILGWWTVAALPVMGAFVMLVALAWARFGRGTVPLMAALFRRRERAVVLRALGVGVEGQRPIGAVLGILARGRLPWRSRRKVERVRAAVERGDDWCASLRKRRLIQPAEAALLDAAGRAGNLPWALQTLADAGERRAGYRLTAWVHLLQPLVTAGLGVLVLLIAVSYFYPLIRLLDAMAEIR